MKKKERKLPKLSAEHKEALAELSVRPEFHALERLFRIEENNIIIQSFKVNSSDPEIARKKAHFEGRIFEIRKVLKTFEMAKRGKDK